MQNIKYLAVMAIYESGGNHKFEVGKMRINLNSHLVEIMYVQAILPVQH